MEIKCSGLLLITTVYYSVKCFELWAPEKIALRKFGFFFPQPLIFASFYQEKEEKENGDGKELYQTKKNSK